MNGNNTEDVSVSEKEGSESLCTLCVLEMYTANSDGISSIFSSTLESLVETNCGGSEHRDESNAGRPNCIAELNDRKISHSDAMEATTAFGGNDQPQTNKHKLTPSFDNLTNTPKSFTNLLKRLESTENRRSVDQLLKLQDEKGRSLKPIVPPNNGTSSLEYETVPHISRAIVHDIRKRAGGSVVSPTLEPIGSHHSSMTDTEVPLKRIKLNNAVDLTEKAIDQTIKGDSKTNTPVDPIDHITNKKPRIIASEILKVPQNQLLTTLKKKDSEQVSETVIRTKDFVITEEFQGAMKGLMIPKDAAETNASTYKNTKNFQSETNNEEKGSNPFATAKQIQRVHCTTIVSDDCSKIDNSKAHKLLDLKSESIYQQSHWNTGTPRSPVNWSMVQAMIAENSKRLDDQAKEMWQLSLYIDKLRLNSLGEGAKVALSKKETEEKSKREFVSKGTQTTEPPPANSVSKIPLIVNIDGSKLRSRPGAEFEHALLRSSGPRKNGCPAVANHCEPTSPKNFSIANIENIRNQISADATTKNVAIHQQSDPMTPYDRYYNPLRPRRWPNNRNTAKFTRRSLDRYKYKNFPPLPVLVEVPKPKQAD